MYKNLCVWGLKGGQIPKDEASVKESINLANATGYEGVELWMATVAQLAKEKSVGYVKSLLSDSKVIPAGWPVEGVWWEGGDEEYHNYLEKLPLFAKTGQDLDCNRMYIGMPNWSDERDYQENFRWHIERIKPIAKILGDFNCKIGLEWQGPKTLRIAHKYEFIHDMKSTLQLIEEIDEENVGLLLDSFHWYTSYGTIEDIVNLKGKTEVIYIHINDAPKGIPIDEQIDYKREIPGTTGVIDLIGFLKSLKEIGYDGPIEPTAVGSKILENKSVEEAAKLNSDALTKLFQEAGI